MITHISPPTPHLAWFMLVGQVNHGTFKTQTPLYAMDNFALDSNGNPHISWLATTEFGYYEYGNVDICNSYA